MTAVEEWRVVPSEPRIMASSWGRIQRLPHFSGTRTYTSEPTYGVVQRAKATSAHCYLGYRYRGIGTIKVHRLVCEAFHGPSPEGKPYVLHRDEDSTNNLKSNLYWGTQKENLNAPGFVAYCRGRTGDASPVTKGIRKMDDLT